MKPRSFFPWRLFRWFLTQQIVFASLLFLVLTGALLLWLERRQLDPSVLAVAQGVVVVSLLSAFISMAVVTLWMARRLMIPLGRLIDRTRRMRESPFEEAVEEPEAMAYDEPGEWFELERAINKLGRDLRNKTIRLSREKTELRAIMSAASEAVLAVSSEKKVLFYNPQFAYLFRTSPSTKDLQISDLIRAPDILEAYQNVLKTGQPVRKDVQEEVSEERIPRDFLLSVAPLKKKHNQEIYGVVGIFHDITELKQAERIRIEFVGNVSHELRTPLTSISGYLQTLSADFEKGRTDSVKEFLSIVAQNVARLRALVEDLLDLSSLESGKELNLEWVNVQDVTEAVIRQLNPQSHRVHLSYEFNEIWADPKRLEQVVRNLLENAVRYVPAGGNIDVRWRKGPSGHMELVVKDDGPGIAPKHQARLFERFYRVDESRARAVGGTGIGLSLVKHIVQRHGGQVQVKSQLGQGSEFICDFPPK